MKAKRKTERILVLIRHAHRDTTDRAADNGLSEKGRAQAKALLKFYLKTFPPAAGSPPPRVLSSPKRRCVETVEAIVTRTQARLELDSELEEQRHGESGRALELRVEQFISRWSQGHDPLVIACSHGDWLPVAMHSATGVRAELKKGGWAEIRLREGEHPQLRWLLQSVKRS